MRYVLMTIQGILLTAVLGIGIYVVVVASDLYSRADDCKIADLPGDPVNTTCQVMGKYDAQATTMVAWALFAVALAIAAAAIRPAVAAVSGSGQHNNWGPVHHNGPQGPQTGGQPMSHPMSAQQPYGQPGGPPPHQ